MPRIVSISDTHSYHRKIVVPDGDVLIHAGDITFEGELATLKDFNSWLGDLPHRRKIVIMGNHELGTAGLPAAEKATLLSNAHLLDDSAIELDGLKYYGSPWQPWFLDWEYNFPKDDPADDFPAARAIWGRIPAGTNVLVTHGPPRGILDLVDRTHQNVGCPILRDRIFDELDELKLHVFGHIHCAYGSVSERGVTFVNASTCTEEYRPVNPPIVTDI